MDIGRNDPCSCGSGKKYKKCCLRGPSIEQSVKIPQMPSHQYSLNERNRILFHAIGDIFQLNKVEWDEVKTNISGDQIRELYKVYASLWPPNTDWGNLTPKPDDKLRALYLGDVAPELIIQNTFRFGLYTDEILIINPFLNPWCMGEKYDPTINPDQYKADVLKLIVFMGILGPWIDANIVTLIPDPGDFDYTLRRKTWNLAKERLKDFKLTDIDKDDLNSIDEETERLLLSLPESYLSKTIKKTMPNISDEKVVEVLKYFEKIRKEDPLALNQTLDKSGGQTVISRSGANLEMALYIAQATGAFPYTNIKYRWNELLSIQNNLPGAAQVWSPLTKAFQGLEFKFLNDVDSKFACEMRAAGRLKSFRALLRRLWNTLGTEQNNTNIESKVRDFKDALTDEYHKAKVEWGEIDQSLIKWVGGSTCTAAIGQAIITGGMSLEIPAIGFAMSAVTNLILSHLKRKGFRQKIPMSVFVDLSRHKNLIK